MNEHEGRRGQQQNTQFPLKVSYSRTNKIVLGAVFTALAAIFQSAGVFAGIGYALSILTTLPIVLSCLISLRIGIMSYFNTILLLMIFLPSELFVFPFTTGLLGISLGTAFKFWKNWLSITVFGGSSLTAGIMALLYVFGFPVLGPTVSHTFNSKVVLLIFLFSLVYSWIWMVLGKKAARLLMKSTIVKK
ncbi:hypothetical protein FAY30_13570 [Bacillus sp. S3]|uniref:hypothetical protein n=1 Tax=Bacillus sp. S3 TaxID=486398 RepID=UPI00118C6660|nr:hypothetical protein [Bacillus sp. S3]QCJ42856.1 hypothetical protein FAY30_13570 [Bacillus sp. S3]